MGGFELLIQLESLKPWPETSTLMRRVSSIKVISRLDHKCAGYGDLLFD